MPDSPPEIETLTIESLAFGGDGLAHYPEPHPSSGKVVFVQGGLPGEKVSARIIQKNKDFDRAYLDKVIEPSPDRVTPSCPLFGVCGGCQLQHLSYPAQIRIKTEWVAQAAARAGVPAKTVSPAIPSPRELGYRFRVRLRVDGQGRLGFNSAGSNRLVEVPACPIMSPELSALTDRLRDFFAAHRPGRGLELELGALDKAGFVLIKPLPQVPGRKRKGDYIRRLRKIVKELREGLSGSGTGSYFNRPGLTGQALKPPQGSLTLPLPGLSPSLFPGVFAQAQTAQNQALVKTVLDLAGAAKGTRVLDLMAGMGNFSLPLAHAGAAVTAVETDPLACHNGRYNAEKAFLEVEFIHQTAEEFLAGLSTAGQGDPFEVVVADPPRRGLKGLTEPLARLKPKRIVYVSCNPSTLARDLGDLRTQGYQIQKMIPLDLFPQTYHLETVCSLAI